MLTETPPTWNKLEIILRTDNVKPIIFVISAKLNDVHQLLLKPDLVLVYHIGYQSQFFYQLIFTKVWRVGSSFDHMYLDRSESWGMHIPVDQCLYSPERKGKKRKEKKVYFVY
jgi:hypothetical protein